MAHNNLGRTLMDLGQLDEADRELRHALRIDPRMQLARGNLEELRQRRNAADANESGR